jgi:hypothetical protein
VFDPTIYDNLKVVFEGALYDLDSSGRVHVSGREDIVDLATMSRAFRMQVEKLDGRCKAQVELTSGLLDFAGELRRVRLAEEVPGCELRLSFHLPESMAEDCEEIDSYLEAIWGEAADVVHERTARLLPEQADAGRYRIELRFRQKIDEDNMEDVEPLLDHLVATLDHVEEQTERKAK